MRVYMGRYPELVLLFFLQAMSRRLWRECSTCTTENDLKVSVRGKNVCTRRTEEFTSGVSITYMGF